MREDEQASPVRAVFSRELSFVPDNRRAARGGSNPETLALIRRYTELGRLPNGARVLERLEEWKWPWAGRSAADKQRFLEPSSPTSVATQGDTRTPSYSC